MIRKSVLLLLALSIILLSDKVQSKVTCAISRTSPVLTFASNCDCCEVNFNANPLIPPSYSCLDEEACRGEPPMLSTTHRCSENMCSFFPTAPTDNQMIACPIRIKDLGPTAIVRRDCEYCQSNFDEMDPTFRVYLCLRGANCQEELPTKALRCTTSLCTLFSNTAGSFKFTWINTVLLVVSIVTNYLNTI